MQGNRVSEIPLSILLSIFVVSLTVIALQLNLMRALSLSHYHHFSYLVVSLALLGFGTSGTILTRIFSFLEKRFFTWTSLFYLFFALSIPLSYIAAQYLPIDIQYILYSFRQVTFVFIYVLLIFLPFLFGALIIGMSLAYFSKQATVYGANLIGSGIGGIFVLLLMFFIAPLQLPVKTALLASIGFFLWLIGSKNEQKSFLVGGMICSVTVAVLSIFLNPLIPIDSYKGLAHFKRLENQSDARHIETILSPIERIDIYEAESFHITLFAAPQTEELPPDQYALLSDASVSGSILSTTDTSELGILNALPQSLPYRLLEIKSSLLLGEYGGSNIWLAKLYDTENIEVVQENQRYIDFMKNEFREESGGIFVADELATHTTNPRLFLEQDREAYDLIQLVSAEHMPAASGGLASLNENYLLTVSSIQSAVRRLTPNGVIAISRGLQTPPRDNIRVLAIFNQALKEMGFEKPGRHVLQARNYLSVISLCFAEPVSKSLLASFHSICEELRMDIEWAGGFDFEKAKQINIIPGPADESYSYLRFAAKEIFRGNAEAFYQNWAYSVGPVSDDKPFFHNFFRFQALDRFFSAYGSLAISRLELGYLVLIITLGILVILALLFLILPVYLKPRAKENRRGSGKTIAYFALIGFGFMFLEMILMQRYAYFLGTRTYSTSAVITSILVFAGIGSLSQNWLKMRSAKRTILATISIAVLCLSYRFLGPPLRQYFISSHLAIRYLIAVLFLAPLSYFLGWLYPTGLSRVRELGPFHVNLAWGVNGFASVIGVPLGVLLSMHIGSSAVLLITAALYLPVLLVGLRLGTGKTG